MKKLPKRNASVKANPTGPLDFRADEAERDILATLITQENLISDVFNNVDSAYFAGPGCRDFFNLLVEVHKQVGTIEIGVVNDELAGNKTLSAKIGGLKGIAAMMDGAVYTLPVLLDKCKTIKIAAGKRTLSRELNRAITGLSNGFSRKSILSKFNKSLNCDAIDTEKVGFQFTPIIEYMAGELQPPRWRIKDTLEDESLAVLFGPAESFKSFLAIDWGLSIAAQIPWNGHYVNGGPVFSIIGEGKNGYRRRIAAWLKANNVSGDFPFFVSDVPAQILNVESAQEVGNAINKLRAEHGKPALVIIDTLARNFGPGHENDTKDMTTFISHLDEYVGRDFARLIIHHSGLTDQNRSRGNSALRAALDAEYKMSSKEGVITLCCTKMKDAPKFPPFHFTPKVIALGGTEHDPISSVVLSQVEGQQATVKLTTQWKDALNLLHKMCEGKVSESLSEWRKALYEKKIYTRGASYSACDTLSDKGLIVISGDYVRLSELSEHVLFDLPGQGVDVSVLSSPLIRGGHSDTPRTKQQTTVII